MNVENLEKALGKIARAPNRTEFIYDLLMAYDQPKASITRLKKGDYNLAKTPDDVLWKKNVFFSHVRDGDLHYAIDSFKKDPTIAKHHPRFVIVTDFSTLLAADTKTDDSIEFSLRDLPKHYDFFLPWAGLEKSDLRSENPADIKAAEKMGRLYDLIREENPVTTEEERHALNVFLARLLFCFFAEDTGIFEDDQFTNAIASHTAEDGSDLRSYLERLFLVLDAEDRSSYPSFLQAFPYVNGGLFTESLRVPRFNKHSRKLIIESGTLNWKAINPDIFGSMIQSVVSTEDRSTLGLHYTSVVNIMKVLDPLFLDEYRTQLKKAGSSEKKLKTLLDRLYTTRVFDPACGCGNFLVIAYKELCRIEIEIFRRLNTNEAGHLQIGFTFNSGLQTNQFSGIEIDHFAHEIAKVSLWLAEHQMNIEFEAVFGHARATLPLQDGGNIVCGNATRMNWDEVCPKVAGEELFVAGNPPYRGARYQEAEQKQDMQDCLSSFGGRNNLDYVSCWFHLGAELVRSRGAHLAFVSTNSVCQGSQVPLLWPNVLRQGVEIGFAHQSFLWTNRARGNAGVTCVVINLRPVSNKPKQLFAGDTKQYVKEVSPYLTATRTVYVSGRRTALSQIGRVAFGSMPNDGGHLMLDLSQRDALLREHPDCANLIRPCIGSKEFIHGIRRWCLWISDEHLSSALKVPEIARRINSVHEHRASSKRRATRLTAARSHQFAEVRHIDGPMIVIPKTSSERRDYIPLGFLDNGTIVTDAAFAVFNPEPYVFGLLSSQMHMLWVDAVGGRIRTDYRYSSSVCFNTFPVPALNAAQRFEIGDLAFEVLEARETHSELSLEQLYDPVKMPPNLKAAHARLDRAVERCYQGRAFERDQERIGCLFKLYETRHDLNGDTDA